MSPPHAVLPYGHPPDAYGHVTRLLQPLFALLLLMLPMMFAYGQVTVEDDVAYGGCFRNKLLIINTVFLHAQRINLVTAPARRAKKQYSPVWISCSALYIHRFWLSWVVLRRSQVSVLRRF